MIAESKLLSAILILLVKFPSLFLSVNPLQSPFTLLTLTLREGL